MEPKYPDEIGFWVCHNCGVDSEKDFDEAVLRALELGVDIIAIINEENEEE